ncbi:carotenoid biosynthesis protein [Lentzea sp. E54]|uniref:carotenoid biosynthesis protein n=1 Tax=Lentzea xerophila TaxID=3435883 RepID=UPI003DA2EF06
MPASQRSGRMLWVATAAVFAGLLLAAFVPGVRLPLVVAQVGFALWHGAQRYGWRAIGVFTTACLLVSNVMENLSIETGFPFGHYHYTAAGKIFEVPWFIGPAYLATGYLAWVAGTVLLGDVHRDSPWPVTVGTPVVGAFAMTAWDLAMDPATSTIHHTWIWERGGGFFGVPLVNFLGWTLTVYLFMQIFALYLRGRGQQPIAGPQHDTTSDLQAVLLYAATTIYYFVKSSTGERTTVTDAAGATWRTGDIYVTSVLLTIYGMVFITVLALLRIARRVTSGTSP